MTECALLKRLQPLLIGVQSAEDFVQELLEAALTDLAQRISAQHGLVKEDVQTHIKPVLATMRVRLLDTQPGGEVKFCRGLTKAKKRCRCKAQPLSEFCRRHADQRAKYQEQQALQRQMREHQFVLKAGAAADHTHRWEGKFVASCAACRRNATTSEALTFSGQTASYSGSTNKRPREDGEEDEVDGPANSVP